MTATKVSVSRISVDDEKLKSLLKVAVVEVLQERHVQGGDLVPR